MLDKEVNEYRCPYDDCSEYLKKNKIRTAKDPLTHHKRRYHNDRDLAIYKLAIDAYNKGERISYREVVLMISYLIEGANIVRDVAFVAVSDPI